MNDLKKLPNVAGVVFGCFVLALSLWTIILARKEIALLMAKKAQTEVVAPTTSTLAAEKVVEGLKTVEDETGITTKLGWKAVVLGSIRWDKLSGMYQIRYGANLGKDGQPYDIRSAWVHSRVLDPARMETAGLIKLWQMRKDLKALIVTRTAYKEFLNTSFIAVEVK